MQLIIGNRNYSSWSLRAWLAARHSGLSFQTRVVNIDGEPWETLKREDPALRPSAGKVPVLWEEAAPGEDQGPVVVWDSLAILEYLADRVGHQRFWPTDRAARGLARSMVAEMHSAFLPLRRGCPMNVRARIAFVPDAAVQADILRILGLWAEARARFGQGGPYLFGTFGAADIFYAPVITRFVTYGVTLPGFAGAYARTMCDHPWMREWIEAAGQEPWRIARFELEPAS